jgi:hypothetical protein
MVGVDMGAVLRPDTQVVAVTATEEVVTTSRTWVGQT